MWLFAMFDLPVTTAKARKRYAKFRKVLLEQGFSMLQYSVYARYCASEEMADAYRGRIRTELPPEGYVPRPGRHRSPVRQDGELHWRNEPVS